MLRTLELSKLGTPPIRNCDIHMCLIIIQATCCLTILSDGTAGLLNPLNTIWPFHRHLNRLTPDDAREARIPSVMGLVDSPTFFNRHFRRPKIWYHKLYYGDKFKSETWNLHACTQPNRSRSTTPELQAFQHNLMVPTTFVLLVQFVGICFVRCQHEPFSYQSLFWTQP